MDSIERSVRAEARRRGYDLDDAWTRSWITREVNKRRSGSGLGAVTSGRETIGEKALRLQHLFAALGLDYTPAADGRLLVFQSGNKTISEESMREIFLRKVGRPLGPIRSDRWHADAKVAAWVREQLTKAEAAKASTPSVPTPPDTDATRQSAAASPSAGPRRKSTKKPTDEVVSQDLQQALDALNEALSATKGTTTTALTALTKNTQLHTLIEAVRTQRLAWYHLQKILAPRRPLLYAAAILAGISWEMILPKKLRPPVKPSFPERPAFTNDGLSAWGKPILEAARKGVSRIVEGIHYSDTSAVITDNFRLVNIPGVTGERAGKTYADALSDTSASFRQSIANVTGQIARGTWQQVNLDALIADWYQVADYQARLGTAGRDSDVLRLASAIDEQAHDGTKAWLSDEAPGIVTGLAVDLGQDNVMTFTASLIAPVLRMMRPYLADYRLWFNPEQGPRRSALFLAPSNATEADIADLKVPFALIMPLREQGRPALSGRDMERAVNQWASVDLHGLGDVTEPMALADDITSEHQNSLFDGDGNDDSRGPIDATPKSSTTAEIPFLQYAATSLVVNSTMRYHDQIRWARVEKISIRGDGTTLFVLVEGVRTNSYQAGDEYTEAVSIDKSGNRKEISWRDIDHLRSLPVITLPAAMDVPKKYQDPDFGAKPTRTTLFKMAMVGGLEMRRWQSFNGMIDAYERTDGPWYNALEIADSLMDLVKPSTYKHLYPDSDGIWTLGDYELRKAATSLRTITMPAYADYKQDRYEFRNPPEKADPETPPAPIEPTVIDNYLDNITPTFIETIDPDRWLMARAIAPQTNKQNTLDLVRERLGRDISEGAARDVNVRIERIVALPKGAYDTVTKHFLEDGEIWGKVGGTSLHPTARRTMRPPEGDDGMKFLVWYQNLPKESQEHVRNLSFQHVTLFFTPGKPSSVFFVDTQGYDYARYVYLPADRREEKRLYAMATARGQVEVRELWNELSLDVPIERLGIATAKNFFSHWMMAMAMRPVKKSDIKTYNDAYLYWLQNINPSEKITPLKEFADRNIDGGSERVESLYRDAVKSIVDNPARLNDDGQSLNSEPPSLRQPLQRVVTVTDETQDPSTPDPEAYEERQMLTTDDVVMMTPPEKLLLTGEIKAFLGSLLTSFNMLVWGPAGTGKSSFLLKLADALARTGAGDVLYAMSEERISSGRLQQRINLLRAFNSTVYFDDSANFERLVTLINSGKYRFVVVDSINAFNVDQQLFIDLMKSFPEVSFVLTAQTDKSRREYKGLASLDHAVDTVIRTEHRDDGAVATTVKHRDGNLGSMKIFTVATAQSGNNGMRRETFTPSWKGRS